MDTVTSVYAWYQRTVDEFDPSDCWLTYNWQVSVIFSAIYVIAIFSIQNYMKDRTPYSLRLPLTLWSFALAIFSIIGSYFTFTRHFAFGRKNGFYATVCDTKLFWGEYGFWMYLFGLSKAVELGDTVFIVLRKGKLIFLHWYHHIATLIYSWWSYANMTSTGLYFTTMNLAVHSLMYSYYALRASGVVQVPRSINIVITTLQLLQMALGLFVNLYAFSSLRNGLPCSVTLTNIYISFAMYFSYFVLFGDFFMKSYVSKKKKTKGV